MCYLCAKFHHDPFSNLRGRITNIHSTILHVARYNIVLTVPAAVDARAEAEAVAVRVARRAPAGCCRHRSGPRRRSRLVTAWTLTPEELREDCSIL